MVARGTRAAPCPSSSSGDTCCDHNFGQLPLWVNRTRINRGWFEYCVEARSGSVVAAKLMALGLGV